MLLPRLFDLPEIIFYFITILRALKLFEHVSARKCNINGSLIIKRVQRDYTSGQKAKFK